MTARRAAIDFAECMRDLVSVHSPDAQAVRVVRDNPSTHKAAALSRTHPLAVRYRASPAETRPTLSQAAACQFTLGRMNRQNHYDELLARSRNFISHELNEIARLIEEHRGEITRKWNEHFSRKD